MERIRADRARDAPDERDVRWVRMDGLHLTLRFLGPTPEADVPTVAEAVRRAASTAGPVRGPDRRRGIVPEPAPATDAVAGRDARDRELASLARGG